MILFNLNNLKELLESLGTLKCYCDSKDISYEDVRIELKDKRIEINIPTKERGILTYNSHNKIISDKEALKKLKKFREEIDGIINCMEIGETYNTYAINIKILLEARDCIAKARAVE